eukprot:6188524-Pleurochrysis_carterae.AAC.2
MRMKGGQVGGSSHTRACTRACNLQTKRRTRCVRARVNCHSILRGAAHVSVAAQVISAAVPAKIAPLTVFGAKFRCSLSTSIETLTASVSLATSVTRRSESAFRSLYVSSKYSEKASESA